MATITRIIEFLTRIFNPKHGFFPNDETMDLITFSNELGLTFTICIELTLILTIFKLKLGLKLINGKLNNQEVKRYDKLAWTLTLIFFFTVLIGGILRYIYL